MSRMCNAVFSNAPIAATHDRTVCPLTSVPEENALNCTIVHPLENEPLLDPRWDFMQKSRYTTWTFVYTSAGYSFYSVSRCTGLMLRLTVPWLHPPSQSARDRYTRSKSYGSGNR